MFDNRQSSVITFNDRVYLLSSIPVMDNYGTDGGVRFYAPAVDAAGNSFQLAWDLLPDFDISSCDGFDFSAACDWDNPVAIDWR